MKRLCALLLAGLLTLSMAACGNEPSGTQAVSAGAASSAANTPEPAPSATVDAGETAEKATAASDDPYAALEAEIESETETALTELSTQWEELHAGVGDYGTYMAKAAEIEAFYTKVYETSASLCIKMREYSIEYAEAVLATGKSSMDMYDDLDGIFDLIYDDMGDDIYDGIYDGVLDDMYDGLYGGALDDIPEGVEYADWSDARSDEYDMWSDMRSEVYDQWSDFRSDVYGFWSDVKGEVFSEDIEGAQDEIADFVKDTEKESGELLPADGTEETEPEVEPEAQPVEPAEAAPTADGIRPEFKAAMDSYEAFFDEYVAFMEEYAESTDAAGMSTEYIAMMQQYLETMEAMQELGEEELSDEEALYYAEVSLRISQKLMEAA